MTQDNRSEKLRRDGSATKSIQGYCVNKNRKKKEETFLYSQIEDLSYGNRKVSCKNKRGDFPMK